MSVSSRAPARFRPGAPLPHRRWRRFLAVTAGAAAALGLAVTTGPAASASAHAAPAAPLDTYYVAPNGTDTSGSCTANTAINAFPTIADGLACAVNGDAISLAPTGSTPYQGFGTVSQNITISAAAGANARTVTVDATASASLTVAAGATVTVTGVTIDGSNAASSDVTNDGTLTLTRDAITNNQGFGGILNSGATASLTLNASTVSGNVNGGEGGGGITSGGSGATLTVNNSTIAGNSSPGSAVGGVAVSPGTSATFVNSTIAGNSSQNGAGGLRAQVGATTTLSNTLIAGNTGGASFPDCAGILTDGPGGHNLIGNSTGCSGLTNGVNGDQLNVAPGLLPLASNGGPTNTAALVNTSPAVGAGDPATCEQAPISGTDQRGHSRNATTRGCDIGSYDTGGPSATRTYFVAPGGTDSSGSCPANSVHNAFPAIAAALACAVNGNTVSLAPTGGTPYAGFGTVSRNVTIGAARGANARTVAVDESSGVLTVAAGATVTLTGVTLNGGSNVTAFDVTNNGTLTLTRDTITGSRFGGVLSTGAGGSSPVLRLNDTTVSGNYGAEAAGGIIVLQGTVTVDNSTIAGNTGGVTAAGVDLQAPAVGTFVNSTITGNQGQGSIGGLQVWGGATATLSNTIIAGNTSTIAAFPPDCNGTLTDGPGGHNLIGNTGPNSGGLGCSGLTNGVNGDQLNVPAPGLGALANNGGPTDTAALTPGSPAIGTGSAITCEHAPIANKDQRGDNRNASTRGACDIGAYDTGGA